MSKRDGGQSDPEAPRQEEGHVDDKALLKDRGWRERATENVRRWYHRNYPAATYRLGDAVELERRKK